MSYYRPSFTQSTGGMSRGRGGSFSSTRGSSSYRGGSNRGSSSWNSGSRGYHGTSSRGGSSTAYRSSGGYSGFDTRSAPSKYGERMTSFRGPSGGGGEEYRKPTYRPDTSYSRESRLSPERKRMRTESRHDSYSDSSSFRTGKQLTSTPFHRTTGGDFRKPLAPPPPPNISNSYSSSSSVVGRYRGGRRISSRYIVSASAAARSERPHPPRRLMDYSTTMQPWRGSSSREQHITVRALDFARRLRLRQVSNRSSIIRSSRPLHSSRIKRNDSDDELWGAVRNDDDDDDDDEDEENEGDADEKEMSTTKSAANKESSSAADNESEAKASTKKCIVDDGKGGDDKEMDDDDGEERRQAEEKKPDGDEGVCTEVAMIKKKSPTKKASLSKDREREVSPHTEIHRRKFIKLVCPYCHTRCITFARYSNHLRSARHSAAMHHVALKQKTALSRMRIAQRSEQKAIERSMDEAELTVHTHFCPLCKLNYRQSKMVHRATKSHRDMKKFLMPVCKVCQITCKSPMLYETHCASLEHIKRKAYSAQNGDGKSDKSEHSGDDLQNYMTIDSVGDIDDIDMDIPPPPPPNVSDSPKDSTLSALDSAADSESANKSSKPPRSGDRDRSSAKREREPPVNIGVENIRKIEVHYCDLCRMYLPRVEESYDDLDRILAKHCKQRTHMQRYIRYKEDKDLAKRAEKLQRREMAEKEKEKDAKKVAPTASKDEPSASKTTAQTITTTAEQLDESSKETPNNQEESSTTISLNETLGVTIATDAEEDDKEEDDVKEILEADEAEAGEDKLWEDVDKDLGDILAGEKQEDEEDEEEEEEEDDGRVRENGERYDRFKYSEKNTKPAVGNVVSKSSSKPGPKCSKKIAEVDSGGTVEKNQVEGGESSK